MISYLFAFIWGIVGIIFMIAGKPFIEVAACFLIYGILSGVYEMHEIRMFLNGFKASFRPIRNKEDLNEIIHELSKESDGQGEQYDRRR